MNDVYLGLGANVGDAIMTLTAAVYALDDLEGVTVVDVSSVYVTDPWPPPDDPRHVPQDPFRNLVVLAETSRDADDLLTETQRIEAAFGRDREREQRWGPRPLDIDLLLVGDTVCDTTRLTLPHPRITERAFVLVPLMEIAPGLTLPGGVRVTQALAALAPFDDVTHEMRLADVPTRHLPRPLGPDGGQARFTTDGRHDESARR
jgi:2-amino-4-hydroxy-6-hydroxymethyldihydropteridine diphosphokinase